MCDDLLDLLVFDEIMNENQTTDKEELIIDAKLPLKFEDELREKMFRAKKECNYNPTYFLKMLNENGGVKTAKILIEKAIRTGKTSDGFITMMIEQRLDLTMEDSVVKDEYSALFSEEEIKYCKSVLNK